MRTIPGAALYAATLFCASALFGQTDIISTYAGTGTTASTGDGGPATSASLYVPMAAAVDRAGNLYFAEGTVVAGAGSGGSNSPPPTDASYSNGSRIRRIDAATGVITTVAGTGVYGTTGDGGPAVTAAFGQIASLAVDSAANIYASDNQHHIRRIDATTGIVTTIAGNGTKGFAGDGGSSTAALLSTPIGLAVDAAGNVYVADSRNFRIRRIDAVTGLITTVAGNGTAASSGDGGPASAASLLYPNSLAIDATGNLYVSESDALPAAAPTQGGRIRRIDAATGVITTVAGTGILGLGPDGIAGTLSAINPSLLAADGAGSIYFTESYNHVVRKLDMSTGLIWTIAGGAALNATARGDNGPAPSANLKGPFGVALVPQGPLYITDGSECTIRKVSLPGKWATTSVSIPALTAYFTPGTTNINLQATLLSSDGAPANATGQIAFWLGSRNSNPYTSYIQGGKATISFPTSTPRGTVVPVIALYSGDGSHGASLAPTTNVTFIDPPTTVALSASKSQPLIGQQVVLTAVLSPSGPGAFYFYDGATWLGGNSVQSDGSAQFTTSFSTTGAHNITAVYTPGSGSTITSAVLTESVVTASSLVLSSSGSPSAVGQAVTLSATVTPAGASGAVQFYDNGTLLGAASLSNGVAALTTTSLGAGVHSLTATYGGDGSYAGSSATYSQTMLKTTSVTITASTNPALVNQAVTLTATLSAAAATGSVQFLDGGTLLATATIASGVASYSTSALAVGSHTITAVYSGDAAYQTVTSTSALSVAVKNASAISLTDSSSAPVVANTPITLTAAVTPATATGTVQFLDGGATVLATVTLTNGTASFTTSLLATGSHALTAVYSGDANDTSATSAVVTQSILKTTGFAVSSTPNPAAAGQSVTVSATLDPAATGTVQIFDGGTLLSTVALAGGTATFSTSSLAPGSHSLLVNYSGDSTFAGASAGAINQVVKRVSTVSLTSSANPAAAGSSVTLTATIAPAAATGSVQFLDGASVLATVALTNGVATYTTASLTAGTHSLTASYSGDAQDTTGASGALTQTVRKVSTLGLTASANPSIAGQSVTLTATVDATATGTIQFSDGAAVLGTASIANGVATFSTNSLAVGTHSLSASYNGDSAYTSASVTGYSLLVKAASTVALTSSGTPAVSGQTVTFTATVAPAAATGTVQFLDGATVLGTANLASGKATLATATLSTGTHAITVSYSGDANDSSATSSTLSQVVQIPAPAAPTGVTATASGASQINVTWATGTGGVTYNVYASTVAGFTPSAANRVATGLTAGSFAHTNLTASTTYYYSVTAVNSTGESAASAQASATTSAAAGGGFSCHVSYSVTTQWNTGFGTALSIQNTGTTTISSWTLTWTWANSQQITQAWNANYAQTGANAKLTSMSYNGSLAPGATASGIGFNANFTGVNTAPAAWYVNGVLCK